LVSLSVGYSAVSQRSRLGNTEKEQRKRKIKSEKVDKAKRKANE